jgi:hypothetical protein
MRIYCNGERGVFQYNEYEGSILLGEGLTMQHVPIMMKITIRGEEEQMGEANKAPFSCRKMKGRGEEEP